MASWYARIGEIPDGFGLTAMTNARLCSGLYIWIVEGLCRKTAKRHLAVDSRFRYVFRRGTPEMY